MALAIYGLSSALYQNSVFKIYFWALNGQHETFFLLHDASCDH